MEPIDYESTVVSVPLDRLSMFRPFEICPWLVETPISQDDVRVALLHETFVDFSFSGSSVEWTRQMHIDRIAWLVRNPDNNPIEIEFPYPSEAWMELTDGWHRLAAAQFAKRPYIDVEVTGFIDHALEAFGAPQLENLDQQSECVMF
jgi:hypothetical protein